jgi:hypothetical protein
MLTKNFRDFPRSLQENSRVACYSLAATSYFQVIFNFQSSFIYLFSTVAIYIYILSEVLKKRC